ncbi:MAG TPA: hypothetical protein VFO67_14890, partial [Gemmatimonadales bacterium]|nr:hypothetical protein [Gemmatimonadales bacterium]
MKKLLALALAMGMQPLAAQQDPRASLLVDRGCSDCHTIAALKVTRSKADVGPDLSAAYIDVP